MTLTKKRMSPIHPRRQSEFLKDWAKGDRKTKTCKDCRFYDDPCIGLTYKRVKYGGVCWLFEDASS